MPWCETCDRFYNPNTLLADGTCPTCGRAVAQQASTADDERNGGGAPWHFKVLLVVTAVYLGYRLLQGLFWMVHHL